MINKISINIINMDTFEKENIIFCSDYKSVVETIKKRVGAERIKKCTKEKLSDYCQGCKYCEDYKWK